MSMRAEQVRRYPAVMLLFPWEPRKVVLDPHETFHHPVGQLNIDPVR